MVSPTRSVAPPVAHPLVILLHGLGRGPGEWLEYGNIHEVVRHQTKTIRSAPPFVAIPAGESGYWTDWIDGVHLYGALVLEYLEHLRARFPVSRKASQTTIAGLSMGGFGALSLGLRHPTVFGTVVALSPTDMELAIAKQPSRTLYTNVFGVPPNMRRVRALNPIRLVERGAGRTQRFLLAYGTDEPEKFVRGAHRLVRAMRRNGVDLDVRVVEGGRHAWARTWGPDTQKWWVSQLYPDATVRHAK